MKYRVTDYILPILAPLMVYIVILVGFVWQHEQNNEQRVRYRLIEIVNVLLASQDNRASTLGEIKLAPDQQVNQQFKKLQHKKQLPDALAFNVISVDKPFENTSFSDSDNLTINHEVLNLSALARPVFLASTDYWHYISPLNKESALLLSLSKNEAQFAWYNDQQLIVRVAISTLAVILLMLFGFRKYINISVEQAKQIQEHQVNVRTREITLMHELTSSINQLDNLAQAANEIKRAFPHIFVGYSGSILFVESSSSALKPFASWGRNSAYTSRVLMTDAWHKSHRTKQLMNHFYSVRNRSLIIALMNGSEQYGALHLKHDRNRICKEDIEHIIKYVSQLNIALINLQLKTDLKEKVIRDPLTNLYNRRFLTEALEKSLSGAIRYKSTLAILMIDLDYFKRLNDNYGHDVGDLVLKMVADVFKHNLRLSDVACRYGGEEFCIICPDTNLREAYLLAEKLRELIEDLVICHQQQQIDTLTTSIGIAMYPRNGVTGTKLLHLADQALYQAKNNGRNQVVVSEVEEQHQDQAN